MGGPALSTPRDSASPRRPRAGGARAVGLPAMASTAPRLPRGRAAPRQASIRHLTPQRLSAKGRQGPKEGLQTQGKAEGGRLVPWPGADRRVTGACLSSPRGAGAASLLVVARSRCGQVGLQPGRTPPSDDSSPGLSPPSEVHPQPRRPGTWPMRLRPPAQAPSDPDLNVLSDDPRGEENQKKKIK